MDMLLQDWQNFPESLDTLSAAAELDVSLSPCGKLHNGHLSLGDSVSWRQDAVRGLWLSVRSLILSRDMIQLHLPKKKGQDCADTSFIPFYPPVSSIGKNTHTHRWCIIILKSCYPRTSPQARCPFCRSRKGKDKALHSTPPNFTATLLLAASFDSASFHIQVIPLMEKKSMM